MYAYLQISITPYLLTQFDEDLTIGGTVLIALSVGIALGSFLSGDSNGFHWNSNSFPRQGSWIPSLDLCLNLTAKTEKLTSVIRSGPIPLIT